MTYLILAYKRIPFISVSLSDWLSGVMQNSGIADYRRLITRSLIVGIGISAAAYFAALYISFDAGFSIRESGNTLGDLKEEVSGLELSVRQEESGLAQTKEDILQSMERVSAIRYIPTDGSVAVSASLLTH